MSKEQSQLNEIVRTPQVMLVVPTLDEYERLTENAILIVRTAEEQGVTLRLLGGVAVAIHCHALHPEHVRDYHDVDLFGLLKESKGIHSVMSKLGYSADIMFNALQGVNRLKFDKGTASVDVFLDKFMMEHVLDFRERLQLDSLTIPLTDLFLTKIQNVKLAIKDVGDIIALLEDHDVGQSDAQDLLNIDYIAGLCSDEWGLWKTVTDNLEKVNKEIERDTFVTNKVELLKKVSSMRDAIASTEKSWRWKLRAQVGEKVKWYYVVKE
jgi:hypothetical protein